MVYSKGVLVCLFLLVILTFLVPYAWGHDLPSKDLSDYITPYDQKVIELAESIGMKPFLSHPLENAKTAYYWVSENIRYQYDNQTWGKENGDYWQLPSTTLKLRTGDCEDQALLLASLLRALRLPRENVRVAVSYTRHHAWCEIKIPLPIYGLENIASSSLELLKNKKVTVSIGESSISKEISGSLIDEIKAAGVDHNNGWIPLDTTFKIVGWDGSLLPIPFSWWLTYGYNVYKLFGYTMIPERTFQDKARIWTVTKEIKPNENITFEIPCFEGEKIIGVAKVMGAWKEEVLTSPPYYVDIPTLHFITFGGYYLAKGEKICVEWKADSWLRVYIFNENDLRRYDLDRKILKPFPEHYRDYRVGVQGSLEYVAEYSETYYVIMMEYSLNPVRIYSLTIKRKWQETTCNFQVLVNNPHNASIISEMITQRDVEKRFEFNAQETGMYKIVLKNLGAKLTLRVQNLTQVIQIGPIPLNLTQSNTDFIIPYVTKVEEVSGIVDDEPILLYVRIEAFQPPISAEFFGVSENLVAAEQQYVNSITNSFRGDIKLVGDNILNWVILSSVMIALFALAFSLKRWKPPKANSSTELALN